MSVKKDTIFEASAIPLGKWLGAIWLLANEVNPSTYAIARLIGVSQKTAWRMKRRILDALAIQPPQGPGPSSS